MEISLGERIKEFYELRDRPKLSRRIPVILRLDGKAFITYTSKMEKPFDHIFMDFMQKTAFELFKKIQGATFIYQASDEISIFLKDYTNLTTDAWFDYDLCKMCSIGASLTTSIFDKIKNNALTDYMAYESSQKLWDTYVSPYTNFDCRAFNIPKEEITNYFIWRQSDTSRNSIQMLARKHFSQNQLNNKNNTEINDMLHNINVNWNDCSTPEKRGIAIYKNENGELIKDLNIPIFSQDRNYIERFI
jgi:tRNA(His) 5'-end guanylyltransferase